MFNSSVVYIITTACVITSHHNRLHHYSSLLAIQAHCPALLPPTHHPTGQVPLPSPGPPPLLSPYPPPAIQVPLSSPTGNAGAGVHLAFVGRGPSVHLYRELSRSAISSSVQRRFNLDAAASADVRRRLQHAGRYHLQDAGT